MLTTTTANGYRRELVAGLVLATAMWLTRSHDFTVLDALPDTSWAAFFISGLLATRWFVPAGLMLAAGAIDYLALLGGVSDYCVTPAYPFLIPTYLTLWASGRWAAIEQPIGLRAVPRIAFALVLGVVGAFAISNASFYAFAGYFDNMTLLAYVDGVARYFLPFLEGAAIYTGVALIVLHVADSIQRVAVRHQGDRS